MQGYHHNSKICDLDLRSIANQLFRVNDVRRRHAHVDCTISARRTSSVPRSRENAPCARLSGQAKITLASEQPCPRNRRQERVAAVQCLGRSRQSPLRMRMKLVLMKMTMKIRTIERTHPRLYSVHPSSDTTLTLFISLQWRRLSYPGTAKTLPPQCKSLGGRQQSLFPARRTRF